MMDSGWSCSEWVCISGRSSVCREDCGNSGRIAARGRADHYSVRHALGLEDTECDGTVPLTAATGQQRLRLTVWDWTEASAGAPGGERVGGLGTHGTIDAKRPSMCWCLGRW